MAMAKKKIDPDELIRKIVYGARVMIDPNETPNSDDSFVRGMTVDEIVSVIEEMEYGK